MRLRDDDTPHQAMRRHVFRLVSERPELARDDGELAERAGIPYDGAAVTRADGRGARDRGGRRK